MGSILDNIKFINQPTIKVEGWKCYEGYENI